MDEHKCFDRRRILVVDDNPAIHEDVRKILTPGLRPSPALSASAAAVFGEPAIRTAAPAFQVDSALDGREGLKRIRRAQQAGAPYALVFVDMRMPGWDGLETITRLWEQDRDVQIVICSAYSDYTWEHLLDRLGVSDRLFVLKKPFDNMEVLQLASALTERWRLARQSESQLPASERRYDERVSPKLARLTAREKEVLDLLIEGNTNKAIAQRLSRSPRTVEIHRARVMKKMGADTFADLLRIVLASGPDEASGNVSDGS